MAEKDPIESSDVDQTPAASTSKEYDGRYRIGRSGSCSRKENETKKKEENVRSTSRKRKDPPSPPKGNVKETKAKFEEIQNKYRNQTKGKFKRTCKKTPAEVIEDPIAKMLKKMMTDLAEIKTDVKSYNTKIDSLTTKVEDLETKNKNIEEKTENSLKEIRQEIVQVEEKVTNKLMAQIKPSLEGMKNEVQNAACQDLRRLVQEEVELMRR